MSKRNIGPKLMEAPQGPEATHPVMPMEPPQGPSPERAQLARLLMQARGNRGAKY